MEPAAALLIVRQSLANVLGNLQISHKLAMRVYAFAGVNPETVKKKTGKPKDVWGNSYTSESLSKFRDIQKNPLRKGLMQASILGFTQCLAAVFFAALDAGKFDSVLMSYDVWLRGIRKDFKLKEPSELALKKIKADVFKKIIIKEGIDESLELKSAIKGVEKKWSRHIKWEISKAAKTKSFPDSFVGSLYKRSL